VEDLVRDSSNDFKAHVTDDRALADRVSHIEGHLSIFGGHS
jgi:hypothetical protein